MEKKQLNECVRTWSKLYEVKHGTPTKKQVAEVRSLYKALYHNKDLYSNSKQTTSKNYDITRHYRYNTVATYTDRYTGEDYSDYTAMMPALRTYKGEVYLLNVEPVAYKSVTTEEGTSRIVREAINIKDAASRIDRIAGKWAPEGTRKNHLTHVLLVRFKPHIIHALGVNSHMWALSYSMDGRYPAWIDWSAFVEIAHQEATDDLTHVFSIDISTTKHNTKEIENELKEMMI